MLGIAINSLYPLLLNRFVELASKRDHLTYLRLVNLRAIQTIRITFFFSVNKFAKLAVFCTGHSGVDPRSIQFYFATYSFGSLLRLLSLMRLVHLIGWRSNWVRVVATFLVRSFRHGVLRLFVPPRSVSGKEALQ